MRRTRQTKVRRNPESDLGFAVSTCAKRAAGPKGRAATQKRKKAVAAASQATTKRARTNAAAEAETSDEQGRAETTVGLVTRATTEVITEAAGVSVEDAGEGRAEGSRAEAGVTVFVLSELRVSICGASADTGLTAAKTTSAPRVAVATPKTTASTSGGSPDAAATASEASRQDVLGAEDPTDTEIDSAQRATETRITVGYETGIVPRPPPTYAPAVAERTADATKEISQTIFKTAQPVAAPEKTQPISG